ncbi:hypothetical protein [Streptomyces gardneri]|uniref:Uncharacterized protein n=1 Tax=Streptomyces gardneri TaxID=66892 RepID=A0A4Y3RM39_9ACTN|nr:hypothetical protein [Streptomyces gardneri]GEB58911.1 hypothetical protein SGA01_45160 [Streptomyces gardneri]GHG83621.1 hypothetical protein GCM10017674_06210 [Streptomyces gardneri]
MGEKSNGSGKRFSADDTKRRLKKILGILFQITVAAICGFGAASLIDLIGNYLPDTPGNLASYIVTPLAVGLALGLIAGLAQLVAPKVTYELERRARLSLAVAIFVGTLAICGLILTGVSRLLVGAILTGVAVFRFWPSRVTKWSDLRESLRWHILGEVVFHCLALLLLTLGILLMISSAESDKLELAPRITISLSLVLALLVAVNKSFARARKLCTLAVERLSSVIYRMDDLTKRAIDRNSLISNNPSMRDSSQAEKLQRAREAIDSLDIVFQTSLNTGYRKVGAPLMPLAERLDIYETLHLLANDDASNRTDWGDLRRRLEGIRGVCGLWIDAAV